MRLGKNMATPRSKCMRWTAVLLLILTGGCRANQMGYRQPKRWSYIRLPPARGLSPDTPMLKAARYQIQTCENIATAYRARAASRSREGKLFEISAPLLTATGAATTAAASLFDNDSREQTALTISGIIITFVGAGLVASNVFTGGGRAESYSKAATSVSDAIADFRDALRDGELNTEDSNVLKERICTLRSSCFQRHVDLQPVGEPFTVGTKDPTPQTELHELPLVDEYVTAFCSHPSTASSVDIAQCMTSGAERSASCTESVCEEALSSSFALFGQARRESAGDSA